MEKILFINACVSPESRTYLLASEVLKQMEGIVEEVNLEKAQIQPLNSESLQRRDSCCRNKDFTDPMFQYAKQFIAADKIVVAAPYWDLSFPSAVKVYFEAVTVNGVSFEYTAAGRPAGLGKAKKLVYVTTSGGTIGEFNLGYDYIRTLSQILFRIPEVLCFKAENLDIIGADVESIINRAIDEIRDSRQNLN